MTKILSRSEIDELLERDTLGRQARPEEILLLKKTIEERTEAFGLKVGEKLPKAELEKILKDLKLDDTNIIVD